MKSLWSDDDARACVAYYAERGVGEDLALRTYTSRLLGSVPWLVMHGGGNTSVKTQLPDLFGDMVDVLCIKGSGRDLAVIEPDGHPAVCARWPPCRTKTWSMPSARTCWIRPHPTPR
jgi:rhamnose utilization protein RhaD (predicted bifunctional aldolase and dehydrogenase)